MHWRGDGYQKLKLQCTIFSLFLSYHANGDSKIHPQMSFWNFVAIKKLRHFAIFLRQSLQNIIYLDVNTDHVSYSYTYYHELGTLDIQRKVYTSFDALLPHKFSKNIYNVLLRQYPAILFTMPMGFLNHGSFIIHILLPGTSKAFTLSVFLPGACFYIVLPGTLRFV